MKDDPFDTKLKLLPYSDGSGYRFEVSAYLRLSGDIEIELRGCGNGVRFSPVEWPKIVAAVEFAIKGANAAPVSDESE